MFTSSSSGTIVKDEPVLVTHLVAAILAWVGTFLVTHGILTNTQADALTQAVLPFVVAALIAGLGVVVRHFVTPADKALGFSDADMARIAAYLEAAGYFHQSQVNQAVAQEYGPASKAIPATDDPQGMSAGASSPPA
jgi:hypothetical protein